MILATRQVKISGHEEAARLPQLHRIRDSSQTGPVQYDGAILDLAKLQLCWQARVSLDSCRELNAVNRPVVGYFEFDVGSLFVDRGEAYRVERVSAIDSWNEQTGPRETWTAPMRKGGPCIYEMWLRSIRRRKYLCFRKGLRCPRLPPAYSAYILRNSSVSATSSWINQGE